MINYKGGVGKTTISLQIAAGLKQIFEKRVLLVDLDPQCSLSVSMVHEDYWIEHIEKTGSIRSVVQSFYEKDGPRIDPSWIITDALGKSADPAENDENKEKGKNPEVSPGEEGPCLDLLPSHLDLPDYEMKLVAKKPRGIGTVDDFQRERYLVLRRAFQPLHKKYDYIIFDCAPNIYLLSRNAILASDYYLVPTIPDFISCYGIPFILSHIRNMQQELRELGASTDASLLGIIRNRVRFAGGHMAREHEEQSNRLADEYGASLFDQLISDRIGVAELLGERQNIFASDLKKDEEVKADFESVVREVMRRTQNK